MTEIDNNECANCILNQDCYLDGTGDTEECHFPFGLPKRPKLAIVWIRLLPDFKTITGHAIYKDGELIKSYIY